MRKPITEDILGNTVEVGDFIVYFTTQSSSLYNAFAVVTEIKDTSISVMATSKWSSMQGEIKKVRLTRPKFIILKEDYVPGFEMCQPLLEYKEKHINV